MNLVSPELNIVAMGSALLTENEQVFTRRALDLSGAEKPMVLTITTAQPTEERSEIYAQQCVEHFENLGVSVENLHAYNTPPTKDEQKDKIGRAAVLFVSGGDTRSMINFWKEHGIADEINNRVTDGLVLSGGSAGAIAWFNLGHSDSEAYNVKEGESWKYIFTEGLGYIKATLCPHYDSKTEGGEPRKMSLQKMLEEDEVSKPVIGITNRAALVLNDGQYKTLQVDETGAAYSIAKDPNGTWIEQSLSTGKISDL